MIRGRLVGWLLAVAAVAVMLGGCSGDCPSCSSLGGGPVVQEFAFTLCVSEVPVFVDQAGEGCGEVVVEFVGAGN
jgi:hypothetical protein